MTVQQVYNAVNTATAAVLGDTVVVEEDLSNIIDVGNAVFSANAVDNYVRALVDHIGKVVFVNRPYSGGAPSVLMDGWEYGSVLEKITAELPAATVNETWELTDGKSYDPNIFYKPTVSSKFYNKKVTFEIPMSFTDRQLKSSFSNAEQQNGFLSMLETSVQNSMTIKTDALIMRTIANMISLTVVDSIDDSGTYTGKTGTRAVNLLYLYNTAYGTTLTPAAAIRTPEFIRFAAYTIALYTERLTKISSIFNNGGKARFTPRDRMHVVMLADFAKAADIYLQSDTYHKELTAFPRAETVPFWQGSGTSYAFDDVSKININNTDTASISLSGILGVIFDRDALGVCNLDRRVTTNYNPKAEFYNNWYKFDAGYFNDTNENFVVFFVA